MTILGGRENKHSFVCFYHFAPSSSSSPFVRLLQFKDGVSLYVFMYVYVGGLCFLTERRTGKNGKSCHVRIMKNTHHRVFISSLPPSPSFFFCFLFFVLGCKSNKDTSELHYYYFFLLLFLYYYLDWW